MENKLNRLFTDYCNGVEINETEVNKARKAVVKLLPGIGNDLHINRDPRGYALKVEADRAKACELPTDWGSYGLIAPDFSDQSNHVETFARITTIDIKPATWFDSKNGNTYHAVKVDVYYEGYDYPSRTFKQGLTYGYDRAYMQTAKKLLVDSLTVPESFDIYRNEVVEVRRVQEMKRERDLNNFAE